MMSSHELFDLLCRDGHRGSWLRGNHRPHSVSELAALFQRTGMEKGIDESCSEGIPGPARVNDSDFITWNIGFFIIGRGDKCPTLAECNYATVQTKPPDDLLTERGY